MKCDKHSWPRDGASSLRTIGYVAKDQCNNCLAHKLNFEWSTWDDNFKNETKHTKEVIIEDPRFESSGEKHSQ